MMKFRKDRIDVVFLVEEYTTKGLRERIVAVGNEYNIIDLQYGVCYSPQKQTECYSALMLVKKKR